MKNNIMVFGLCMFLLVISSCSQQEYYVIEGDSVSWENDYGLVDVTPHTCQNAYCIYAAEITMFLPSQDYDFAFKFDEPVSNARLYEWKELSKQVYNNETQQSEIVYYYDWVDRTNAFTMDTYDGSYYYWVTGVPFIQDETKKYRWEFNKPDGEGKWELLAKRSSEDLISAITNEHYIILDPWYIEGDFITNWNLTAVNENPYGIGANNTHLWVVDAVDDAVYKYLHNGTYIGTWAATGKPMGAVIDNTYIWTTDQDTSRVYKYNMDGGAVTDWALDAANGQPNGIAGNSTHLFVLDGADKEVYRYETDGTYLGKWALRAENANVWGITTNNAHIWVSDSDDDMIFKYETDGTYLSNWSLNVGQGTPTGISYYGTSFWSTEYDNDNVYEYSTTWFSGNLTTTVDLSPTIAYSNTTFNCSATVVDDELGNNMNVTFSSYKNDVFYTNETQSNIINGSTVSTTSIFPTPLTPTDSWWCRAYVIDSTNATRWGADNSSSITVISYPPSIPSILAPDDNSEYFTTPILGCGGSTDPESDTINYTFAESDNTSLQNSHLTTFTWNALTAGSENNWKCRACDNTSQCSDYTALRNVTHINLTPSGTHIALNLTVRDEEDSELLDNTTVSVDWTLSNKWGSKTFNAIYSDSSTYSFYLEPIRTTINITGLIEYDTTISGYGYPRQYYFNLAELVSNIQKNVTLYQLNDTYSTAITIQITEQGVGIENMIIEVQRYNIGSGVYTTVAMGKTSAAGTDVIYLRQTDAWYRFLIYREGNPTAVYISEKFHITSSTVTFGITIDTEREWDYENQLFYTLEFTESSNQFVYTFSDPQLKLTSTRLEVYESSYKGDILLNSTEDTSHGATITIPISPVNGTTYYGVAIGEFIDSNVVELNKVFAEFREANQFGTMGLFIVFLLTIIFAFIAIWNPSLALILTPLPLLFASIAEIVDISKPIAMAVFVAFLIAAAIVGGRR